MIALLKFCLRNTFFVGISSDECEGDFLACSHHVHFIFLQHST